MLYMGSKARIAKHIIPIMQPYIDKADAYVEPFVGGCNMIDKVNHPKRIGNDIDEEVIAMWKALQENYVFPKTFTKDDYYRVRYNSVDLAERGYILGCTFGGKRYNSGFRKDNIGLRDYTYEYYKNIMNQMSNIKNVEFKNENYIDLKFPKNSVIYCDPPYRSTTKYKKQKINYEEFDEWCIQCKNEGNVVFVSEYLGALDLGPIWTKEITCTMRASSLKGQQKIEALYKI